jgi:uncharacterized membrane protein YedE/YeeE
MAGITEVIAQNAPTALAAGGGLIGLVFGYTIYRTNFCTMGSISDFMTFGDWRRFRAWILAATTALIGAQLLAAYGYVVLDKSMYVTPTFNWLGHTLGGLMFGFGMVLAGGCASKNLARTGGGDLRSLVVLIVMGLFAFMAIGGILGPVRNWLEQMSAIDLRPFGFASQSLADLLGKSLKLNATRAGLIVTALIALPALFFCFKDAAFRTSRIHVLSGLIVGLCAVAGWWLTTAAFDDMATKPTNPVSLTFVRPTADTLDWLQRFTADRMPGFGIATTLGALIGAFVAALHMGRFKVTTFSSANDTKRNLAGAALMGVGGVMALGCTVGQAITGVSTLALGSFVTFAAIVFGGMRGMTYLENALMNE